MPQAKANNIVIEYEDMGPKDGPVLLLVMGLAAQMTFWPDAMLKSFTDAGFRVIRFDNRDIGLTSKLQGKRAPHPILQTAARVVGIRGLAPAPYSLHDMVNDTVGLMGALKIKKAHLVGVSMGGMISQLLAGTHPDRVASLTTIMSGTLNPRLPGPSTKITSALFLNRSNPTTREAQIKRAVDMWSLIKTEGDDTSEIEAKLAHAFDRSHYPVGVRRQLAAIIATGDLRPHLRKITAPALVIHGSKDPLAPLEGGKDSARNIKGARLEIIEGMAHDLPKKFLPRITSLIVDHVKSAEKGAAKKAA
jgi:pimeloyl-ACP methyl ester carboxylesterase